MAPSCQIDHRQLVQAPLAAGGSHEPSTDEAGSGGVEAGSGGEAGVRSAGAGSAHGGEAGQANGDAAGGEAGGEAGGSINAAGGHEPGAVTSQGATSSSGGAASTSGGGGTSTGSAAGGAGAVSGAPVGPAAPVSCEDLDGDGVPDCSETLLKNADFDASFAGAPKGWQLSSGATATWDSLDSMSANSGSVVVTTSDGADVPGVDQCVALQTGKSYEAYALTLTQASALTGFARMSASFFSSADCSGNYDRMVVSALEGTLNSWRTLHVAASPALSDGSVRIRLEVLKANNAAATSIHFDSVLLIGK